MSGPWAKNLLGFTLSDKEMENIPYPAVELYTHVIIKDIQAFGLLGACFVAPISAMVKKNNRNWPAVKSRMARYGRNGMLLGVVVGPLMTYMKMRSIDSEDAVVDRCYRLRRNRGQVRVDQWSIVGAAAGAGIASASASATPMFGCVVGMSSGIILAAIYNAMTAKTKE